MKTKKLEDYYPSEHDASMYDTNLFLDWYLEGVREIEIDTKNFRTFLWYGLANHFVTFGIIDIVFLGMKLTKYVPSDQSGS